MNNRENNVKLIVSRRSPCKYSLNILVKKSILLNCVTFKFLPRSNLILKSVALVASLGNGYNVYKQLADLSKIDNLQFKHIFGVFQKSLFSFIFITISAGPLYIDLDSFISTFDSIWGSIILIKGTQSTTIISQDLVKINRKLIVMLIMGTTMVIGFAFIGIMYFGQLEQTLPTLAAIIYTLYLNISYVYIVQLSVVLVATGYKLIEKRLETCSIISNTNLGHIRLCRQCHNQLVQVTELIGTTFKHVFSSFICLFVPQFVISIYQLIGSTQPLIAVIILIFWNCVNFFYVITLSQSLAKLHTLPQSYYLTLYLTSFGLISNVVKLEIRQYLGYIAQRDTGFKMWANFLVTGQLLPKLAALVFSYLTAGANFLE